MTDLTLKQRARELLAAESERDGYTYAAWRIRKGEADKEAPMRAIKTALQQAQQPVTLREVTMEDMANACDAYRREQPASNDLAHPKAMFAALRAILPHGIPALAELDAQDGDVAEVEEI